MKHTKAGTRRHALQPCRSSQLHKASSSAEAVKTILQPCFGSHCLSMPSRHPPDFYSVHTVPAHSEFPIPFRHTPKTLYRCTSDLHFATMGFGVVSRVSRAFGTQTVETFCAKKLFGYEIAELSNPPLRSRCFRDRDCCTRLDCCT